MCTRCAGSISLQFPHNPGPRAAVSGRDVGPHALARQPSCCWRTSIPDSIASEHQPQLAQLRLVRSKRPPPSRALLQCTFAHPRPGVLSVAASRAAPEAAVRALPATEAGRACLPPLEHAHTPAPGACRLVAASWSASKLLAATPARSRPAHADVRDIMRGLSHYTPAEACLLCVARVPTTPRRQLTR